MRRLFMPLIMLLWGCSSAYSGPPSDHFDGEAFFYPGAADPHTTRAHLRWLWEMETVAWPRWVDNTKQPLPPKQITGDGLHITYINHATVLIQVNGINILTDPIWSFRAGPASFIGAKRVRHPGVRFDALPKIDYVLISHNHYDHLDLPTLRRLVDEHQPMIITGLGNGPLLRSALPIDDTTNVVERDWWDQMPLGETTHVTLVPACHNSGRGLSDKNHTLFVGFVIDTRDGQIYFAGDTAYCGAFQQIAHRFKRLRVAILPIGSYEPRWFMKNQHMNPEDAVMAHLTLHAQMSIGMHFATFAEHPEQPIDQHEKDLSQALKKYNISQKRFWIPEFGEGRDMPLFQKTR